MLRKHIKALPVYILCALAGTVVGWYAQVLLCDVWRLQCLGCR